ncbi:MAG: iron-containing alcohol dehydrogenase [Candidatus Omnitrophica bacterium]|nr:iron-containing alcohol dehydrogenase [Candidatus Omnitrophota bacterium]MCM8777027.1 iron-containing alcohol dehydrogenase [Candidatus Omnitrophota bacterium]
MNSIYFYMGAKVYFERGGIEKYIPEIKKYGKKVLIVSGKSFIFKSGLFEKITGTLSKEGIKYISYPGANPEPDTENVDKGAELCIKEGCDCILAVGGGSAIDVGKAIAVVATNGGSVKDYFGEVQYKNEPLPVIVIPTTCGTGSEVTRFAVIVDRSQNTKKTVSSEKIIPKLSILDAEVLATLPVHLVVATGMDAFSHAAESYLAKRADFISKMFARESLKIILEFIPQTKTEPCSLDAREKLLLASLIAGFALNRTGTIIVHGMGYALTILYNTHHGTANALLLPYVFEYLKRNGYEEEMTELELMWGDTERLNNFVKRLGLPSRLRDIGVGKDKIEKLAELAVVGTQRSMKNMKIQIGRDDFKKIFESAW